MTIVIQNEFWDLLVHENRFEIKLSFDGEREQLVVPFEAVLYYHDQSLALQEEKTGGNPMASGDANQSLIVVVKVTKFILSSLAYVVMLMSVLCVVLAFTNDFSIYGYGPYQGTRFFWSAENSFFGAKLLACISAMVETMFMLFLSMAMALSGFLKTSPIGTDFLLAGNLLVFWLFANSEGISKWLDGLVLQTSGGSGLSEGGALRYEPRNAAPSVVINNSGGSSSSYYTSATEGSQALAQVQSPGGQAQQSQEQGPRQERIFSPDQIDRLRELGEILRGNLSEFQLSQEENDLIETRLRTLEAEICTVRPDSGIVLRVLASIRSILESASGSLLADSLVGSIDKMVDF